MAATGSGTWSPQINNLAPLLSPLIPIRSLLLQILVRRALITSSGRSNGCNDTAKVTVGSTCGCANPPTVTLTTHANTICYNTATQVISGTFGGSATLVTPTTTGTGAFAPATASASPFAFTYTPSAADVTAGSVHLTVTTNNPLGSPCTAATDVYILTITAKPNAGPDQTICEYTTATLAGVGAGTWRHSCYRQSISDYDHHPVFCYDDCYRFHRSRCLLLYLDRQRLYRHDDRTCDG